MKKLISLLLAALLCIGCLTPVLAEGSLSSLFSSMSTTAEAFPYTLEDYQLYFNVLCTNGLGAAPVWTTDGTTATATVEGYGTAIVEMNAEGYVTKLSTSMTVSTNDASAANNLGMMIAMVALSSKAAEDITFLSSNTEAYTNELVSGLYALLGNLVEAMSGPVSSTVEVYGDTATFTMSLDISDTTNITMTLGFTYEP